MAHWGCRRSSRGNLGGGCVDRAAAVAGGVLALMWLAAWF